MAGLPSSNSFLLAMSFLVRDSFKVLFDVVSGVNVDDKCWLIKMSDIFEKTSL